MALAAVLQPCGCFELRSQGIFEVSPLDSNLAGCEMGNWLQFKWQQLQPPRDLSISFNTIPDSSRATALEAMWSSSLPLFTGRQTQTLGLAAFLAAIEVRNCLCYEVKKGIKSRLRWLWWSFGEFYVLNIPFESVFVDATEGQTLRSTRGWAGEGLHKPRCWRPLWPSMARVWLQNLLQLLTVAVWSMERSSNVLCYTLFCCMAK